MRQSIRIMKNNLICNKQEIKDNVDVFKDSITLASRKLLTQYKSLVPESDVQFAKQEVMI